MDRIADIILVLPLPPSTNKLWRPGKSREGKPALFKRRDYAAWMEQASWSVVAQRGGDCAEDWFEARIVVPESRRDLGNFEKPILDCCQRGGAITNDKHMRKLTLEIDPARQDQSARIELWSITRIPAAKRAIRRAPEMRKAACQGDLR